VNFDFLAPEAKRLLVMAQRMARGREQEGGETRPLLERSGADLSTLRRRLDQALAGRPKVPNPQVFLGDEVLRLLDLAQADAEDRGAKTVSAAEILFALPLDTGSMAAQILRDVGVTLPELETLRTERRGQPEPDAPPVTAAGQAPLERFARDLTALAEAGKLDPVVGRDGEIRRIMQILGRRAKNNPMLLGDPGVGKTAIVEGLAQRIAQGDVPLGLAGKRLYTLDVGALVAGARFRGEFEERVRSVLDEVRASGGEALLFFDEIHTLMGAGKGDGSLDAANLLKPALARGELSCLGATTVEEYRKHIEKDPAFERRFAPVMIEEPDDATCLAMLRGIKGRYEIRHHVRIQDAALVAAVQLSRRYVADRALPDKAIDLLDEACSRLRLELDAHPDEVDVLERRRRALVMELAAIERDRGDGTSDRRQKLGDELASVTQKLGPLREKWQAELAAIQGAAALAERLDVARAEATAAERKGELQQAAELRYGRIPGLEKELTEAETRLREVQGKDRLLEDAVEPVHIARVVADATGIPVGRMLEGERQKLLGIETKLRERVIGQDDALKVVSHAVKRARAGLADPGKPIGSFLFLGPTGVGKTELTKALAEFLFDDEHALLRFDMSEYMEKHAVARLVGAPPGYVGYEEGGQLTEAVRRRPYAVLLFDEVEKAHPDVFNILLALLDEGRLTDSQGRTVSFANVVLIMTSNLGASAILEAIEGGPDDMARVTTEVKAALRSHFRPEFLNRIDETVIFRPLGRPQIETIVDMQFRRIERLLADQKLKVALTPEARALIADESYDPAFGARPVKRALQRRLRDPLSDEILAGRFPPGSTINVTREGDRLLFTAA
jgi:ATP-dependent Clp protease ATP-binding subunit ClpB